ncbi:hypothetical protein [Bradyrhizobium sp. WSM3983]|uniref:hypothetical protein n=1 Tax=Bradyrhizobium sp. WSM3983 TaxID=1038867 RepID=UPI00047F6C83|nr:hypothetical protein [Bradyrhizobium sp. WSM3983]
MPDGILMLADALTILNRERVSEFAAARKLPAIYEFDQFARDGDLMSYGADSLESFERAAALVLALADEVIE